MNINLKSACCGAPVEFRRWSNRALPKGQREMLLTCTLCGAKNQAREGLDPKCYIVRRSSGEETKSVPIRARAKPSRVAEIRKSRYKTVQNFLDNAPLV